MPISLWRGFLGRSLSVGQLRFVGLSAGVLNAILRKKGLEQDRSVPPPRAKIFVPLAQKPFAFLKEILKPTHIVVVRMGRFGNAYQQIYHAIQLAHHLQIKNLLLEAVDWLEPPFTLPSGLRVAALAEAGKKLRPKPKSILWGRFFWPEEFSGLSHSPEVSKDIRSLSRAMAKSPENPLGDTHLVVHLRGGDVFGATWVPGSYGQPPLAFYQAVLSLRTWTAVTIVHEDRSNPILDAFSLELEKRGIVFRTVSGDLIDDLAVLASAEHLAMSSGSFGRAVADLSPHLRIAYSFSGTILPPITNPKVKTLKIQDRCGDYTREVLSDNWAKTDAQLRLMLNYPESCVALEEP